jgi:hypothetical protein
MQKILLAGLAAYAMATPLRAWNFSEHQIIGRHAYAQACDELRRDEKAIEGQAAVRLALACAPAPADLFAPAEEKRRSIRYEPLNYAEEPVYGEACGLADHIRDPKDLGSELAGRAAASFFQYGVLTLTNLRHFHPAVTTAYMTMHQRALREVVEASGQDGMAQKMAFDAALFTQAFADHFLQDAFASGHMGFNRAGSSVAATLTYHDRLNSVGREVINARGTRWVTKGDNHLADNADVSTHVTEATALSVAQFLRAFIQGTADDRTVDDILPLIPSYYVRQQHHLVHPLAQVDVPVDVSLTLDVWSFSDGAMRQSSGRVERGLMIGSSMAFGAFKVGRRTIHHRSYLGVGRPRSGDSNRTMLEAGYLWRLGLSNEGLIVYEVGIGTSGSINRDRLLTLRLIGGANFEMGKTYLRVQAGPAYQVSHGVYRWGAFTTVGVGYAWRAD